MDLNQVRVLLLVLMLYANFGLSQPKSDSCLNLVRPTRNDTQVFQQAYTIDRIFCESKYAATLNIRALRNLLQASEFKREILLIDKILSELIAREDNKWVIQKFVRSPEFKAFNDRTIARNDMPRREAYARILANLEAILRPAHSDSPEYLKVVENLFYNYPETEASASFGTRHPKIYAFLASKTKQSLRRIQSLSSSHRNDAVILETNRFLAMEGLSLGARCESQYRLARALRKKRQYAESYSQAAKVVKNCANPWRLKAFYLGALLQNIKPKKENLALFNLFLEEYPNHRLSDDVTYWKARAYLARSDDKNYVDTLDNVLHFFPQGDFFNQAGIELALKLAASGETKRAIGKLEAMYTKRNLSEIQKDQLRYWLARLQIYPNPKSLKLNKGKQKQKGLSQLKRLISERPAGYYGILAKSLVLTMPDSDGLSEEVKPYSPSQSKISKPMALPQETPKKLKLAKQLADRNFKYATQFKLEETLRKEKLSREERFVIARIYAAIGREDLSHQVFRNLGLAQLPGKPSSLQDELWRLAYPEAFEGVLQEKVSTLEVPVSLLQGLIREESAFYPQAISWAGARGLCQMMPSTAKDVARKHKQLDFSSNEELLDPMLNISLGAYHLHDLFKSLKHPILVIGAYNAGAGHIQRHIVRTRESELPIDYFVETIPIDQTRNYIKRVASSWATYAYMSGSFNDTTFSFLL